MGARLKTLLACCLAGWVAVSTANVLAHEAEVQEEGIASFYSDRFQGATTASGDAFDQQALTAAHPSLPLGTKVLVTRADTGQEVEVLINDRGPYIEGRIIDLSKRAARELGMLRRGTAPVMVTVR
ncbi:MAG: septal ring lytic transglycosylase RlpA family protein [Halomonas sp.]|uniref:Endolytic peptidoglycan transglycosylase RlpA n=2 Tax=Halomonadaceae TaxID=28256 RepID=A0ABS6ZP18_9GAMM|nr:MULTISPECIES: septal ring lytic transglycosylase RlpA family protein [Halomonas]MBW6390649.1 septal ring lytic transglycosylase RlpA family protein [Halomonas antri]MDX5377807.1 septal ring lytic transglycosylase RlpA family protein [Halomonas sp.]QTP57845.1 septal ring lytic transglycosylase RlpA family protein [Halomonas sulfidivorans]